MYVITVRWLYRPQYNKTLRNICHWGIFGWAPNIPYSKWLCDYCNTGTCNKQLNHPMRISELSDHCNRCTSECRSTCRHNSPKTRSRRRPILFRRSRRFSIYLYTRRRSKPRKIDCTYLWFYPGNTDWPLYCNSAFRNTASFRWSIVQNRRNTGTIECRKVFCCRLGHRSGFDTKLKNCKH